MNRTVYFDRIEGKLVLLAYRISQRARLNLLEFNIHSENFYAELLNHVFNFNFVNINSFKQNFEGIDLLDEKNKIVAQVSANCTKEKIERSLGKKVLQKYSGYRFKFISLSPKDARPLRNKTYVNPYNLIFDPKEDIIDNVSILNQILKKSIAEQKKILEFIEQELEEPVNSEKMYSALTAIVNILSKEELPNANEEPKKNAFEITRKIQYNDLKITKMIIEQYRIYASKINQIYREFDTQGKNKSLAVLQTIRKQYILLKDKIDNADDLFFEIFNNVKNIIKESKNYESSLTYEDLDMYVDIIVVDAFLRCKIFEDPEGYSYVIT